jgi:hypothetical protein
MTVQFTNSVILEPMPAHPFDQFIALTPSGSDRFTGQAQAAYWNMVGPFGGVVAATAVQAVMLHPERLGEPACITANFCAAMGPGAFEVLARPVRTNRSTQHWVVEITQAGDGLAPQTVLTATLVTAARRDTWGVSDMPMPQVPKAADVPLPTQPAPVEWINRYEMRQISGGIPQRFDGQLSEADATSASLSQLWMRDEPPRPLDFCSLTALADVFFPRIWMRRRVRVPVGTVSMTVYFHAGSAQLAEVGEARGQVFQSGFFDQSALLWSADGRPLASTHQTVYYKE